MRHFFVVLDRGVRGQGSGVEDPQLNPLRSSSSKNLTGQAGVEDQGSDVRGQPVNDKILWYIGGNIYVEARSAEFSEVLEIFRHATERRMLRILSLS